MVTTGPRMALRGPAFLHKRDLPFASIPGPNLADYGIDIGDQELTLAPKKNFARGASTHMKLSHFYKATAFAACFAALQVMAVAPNTIPNEIVVTAVGGDVSYSTGGKFMPLPLGAHLHRGDVVKTGASSHADLQIGHRVGVVQVTPHSSLGIIDATVSDTTADQVSDTQLDLTSGAIYARVNKLSKASRYEIRTPRGVAGVRGTKLYLTANGDLTVAEGMAGIAYPNNGGVQTFVVKDGQSISPGDTAPHAAPGLLLRDIVDALRDAYTHGIGHAIQPFVPPVEPFISPTLPGGNHPAVSGGQEPPPPPPET